jgi:hypothetical protein
VLPLLTFTAIVFEVALSALLTTHHISTWCCSFMGNNDDCCQKFSNVKKVHSCWTGYYSSFPALKYALRKLDTSLRHAEMLSVLATATDASAGSGEEWEAALGWGRHTQGILQHHGECLQTGRRVCSQSWLTRQDKTRKDKTRQDKTTLLLLAADSSHSQTLSLGRAVPRAIRNTTA